MSNELQKLMKNNPEWYKDLLYRDVKVYIRDNINSASRSFVAIGYYLKYVRDNELFSEDGYTTIWEFAQGEFSIGKSSASRFMAINDRFSNDGNSPILLEQYRDFSSSKLSEMLTMSDDQLEQVSVTTTVAEIREIKNPIKDEVVATSQQEPEEPYWKKNIIPYPQQDEYIEQLALYFLKCSYDWFAADNFNRVMHVEHSEKEMKDKFTHPDRTWWVKMPDGELYHFNLFDEIIQVYSKSECLGYIEWFYLCAAVQRKYTTFTMDKTKTELEADKAEPIEPTAIDDLDLSVMTYNCLKRAGIDTIDDLCGLTEDKVIAIRNVSRKCLDEINEKVSAIGKSLKSDITEIVSIESEYIETVTNETEENKIPDPDLSCKFDPDAKCLTASKESCKRINDDRCMYSSGWDEEDYITVDPEQSVELDSVETVEADIIQTEPEECFADQCADRGLKFNNWLKANNFSIAQIVSDILCDIPLANDKDPFLSSKVANRLISSLIIKTDAYYSYLTKELDIEPEPVKSEQPELPILRNNDQRKEFIEAYETWPIWIDQELTGERYYRYDFDNGESFVIRVSLCRKYLGWDKGYSKELAYGREEYFILKKDLPFVESGASKSMMIDYLKEIQKKGG